jgi:hypothetical protein
VRYDFDPDIPEILGGLLAGLWALGYFVWWALVLAAFIDWLFFR